MDLRGAAQTLALEFDANLPTPIGRFPAHAGDEAALWYKDDGRCGLIYGGNKLRKLRPFFERALARKQTRLLTFGSAGSHHVLATALLGRCAGLTVCAVLFPQLDTAQASSVFEAIVASGCDLIEARSLGAAWVTTRALTRSSDALIPPGPIGAAASIGYAEAVHELKRQISGGLLPVPDVIVLPTGSGATAAGVLLGLEETGLRSRLLAVAISRNPAIRPLILEQARRAAQLRRTAVSVLALSTRLDITRHYLGPGYGWPTPPARRAVLRAEEVGLILEQTYSGKALAAAADLSKDPALKGQNILFWQTVSQHPMQPQESTTTFPRRFMALRSRLLRPLSGAPMNPLPND